MRCLALYHIMMCNIVRLLLLQSTTDLDIDGGLWHGMARGMAKDNTYVYLDHLLAFDICRPVEDLPWLIISPEIHLSLHANVWAAELSDYPDKSIC